MALPPLQSGYINTGTNTPTGTQKQIAVDNPYITKDDFINSQEAIGLGLSTSSPSYSDGTMDAYILRASAWFNRMCNSYFDCQTIDETRTAFTVKPYNPQLVTVVVANRPYTKINSCYIQVLKWFIEVDVTSSASYIQDFYDLGYFKIVPLLSSSGQGVGSPIPSNIIDRIALGVLWYNYTFGYGTPLTSIPLSETTPHTVYQLPLGYRLIAPKQTVNVYVDGVIQASNLYFINYPNGIVTFLSDIGSGHIVSMDYISNQSIPADMVEAMFLLVGHIYGQASQNPLGAQSYGIQTYNISFGSSEKENQVRQRIMDIVQHYRSDTPKFI